MKKSLAFALIAQAISIAVILAIALQFFQQLKLYSDYTDQVEHTYMVLNQLEQTDIYLKNAETSSRGYIITRDNSFLEPLDEAKKAVFFSMDSLRFLIKDNQRQRALHAQMEKIVYAKVLLQIENVRIVDRISRDSLLKRMKYGLALMDNFMDVMDDMKTDELVQLDDRKQKKDASENKLPEQVKIVFLIAGLSTLIFGFWIFIELRKRFKFQEQLQEKFLELRQNNEELEQLAFSASHDLQEPLRKIRIFSDRLITKLNASENQEDVVSIAQRMNNSATRMQELINDLIRFNVLVQKGTVEGEQLVSINEVVQKAWATTEDLNKDAHIYMDENLPKIIANPQQAEELFKELLENCQDFQSPDRNLEVYIDYEKLKGKQIPGIPRELKDFEYHHVLVRDNGIGFDETYKDKMFKLFQRLHNYDSENEVRRKGMGLAICRRIMINQGGWIDAQGKPGEGTTIHLYFQV